MNLKNAILRVLKEWQGTPEELGDLLYLATRRSFDPVERKETATARRKLLSILWRKRFVRS